MLYSHTKGHSSADLKQERTGSQIINKWEKKLENEQLTTSYN